MRGTAAATHHPWAVRVGEGTAAATHHPGLGTQDMHPRPSSLPHPPHTHPSPLSQGVVITDFDQQYQNPYYQSEQDLPLYVLVRPLVGSVGGVEGRGGQGGCTL